MNGLVNDTWKKYSYTLSKTEENHVFIPKEIVILLEQQDIIALDFLTKSYKKLHGVILNEEEGFNPQLQVSAFLYAQQSSSKCTLPILVICPDELIIKWHYNLTNCGYKTIKIVTENNVNEGNSSVWIVCTTNIKILHLLSDIEFHFVVVDKIDQIATKRPLQRLDNVKFKIGITNRNFYIDPDQKLQWTILNWANPGCAGKLIQFYDADNENFANFRDNYKEWWFRLTWNFCGSFVRPSLKDEGDMNKLLNNWAKQHNLLKYVYCNDTKPIKRKRKSNQKLPVEENIDAISESKRKTKMIMNQKETLQNENNTNSDDSNSTVIYDCTVTENSIKTVAKNAQFENTNCDKLENESSLDEILNSLLNDNSEETLNSDDDSDMFLKSVASIDCFSSKKSSQETIQSEFIFETDLTINKTDGMMTPSCTSDVEKLVSEVIQMVKK